LALSPGTRLGPYEVTARIGVGGMGEVYQATGTKLKRQVAIKVLPEALAHDAGRLARFQREAEVQWIAYSSNENGTDQVYVARYPGLGDREQVSTSVGGTSPWWARDGRTLYYRSPPADVSMVTIDSGPPFSPGIPQHVLTFPNLPDWLGRRSYDVTRDGRFVMVADQPVAEIDATRAPRLILGLNWIEELKRRVPAN
jgi:serine/threonine protein kinase